MIWTLISTVFLTSLLGSVHCAGMCGAFVAFAVGTGTGCPKWRLQAAYNAGRLATYTLLGAAAGALGRALNLGGEMIGLSHAAAGLAGAVMIVFGIATLLKARGVQVPRMPMPALLKTLLTRSHRAAMDLPPTARAATIGLLTTLLPCGWLYAFAITASGTGSPAWGTVTMAVFWTGTLPMLVAVGTGVQTVAGPLGKRLPTLMPVALVAVGLVTVTTRWNIELVSRTHAAGGSLDAAVQSVHSIEPSKPPCPHCTPDER